MMNRDEELRHLTVLLSFLKLLQERGKPFIEEGLCMQWDAAVDQGFFPEVSDVVIVDRLLERYINYWARSNNRCPGFPIEQDPDLYVNTLGYLWDNYNEYGRLRWVMVADIIENIIYDIKWESFYAYCTRN